MSPEQLSDEQLIAQIREQNKELYSEIIRRYQAKLAHYLRKFIRDHDELEDVLQDVFIKSYRNLYGFDIKKRFSPWIYRIAHNEAVNCIKKNSKVAFSLDEEEWDVADEKFDLDAKIDFKADRELIVGGLRELKDKYSEPLILYFFEGMTYDEISDIMRLPRNTVGTLISRGKNLLKQYLEEKKYGQ